MVKTVAKPTPPPSKKSTVTSSKKEGFSELVSKGFENYQNETPQLLKILDSYLVFCVLTGVLQFLYMIIVGTYPYNAFLAGFICSVGSFVLTVNLRMQSNPKHTEFSNKTKERSFADFVFSSLLLFAFAVNFLG
ncbi:Dolichyl-diphosphooligosaccharide-protein glycosyltransferase subunit dad1 [Lobulomyces angularis]|nr:Dolichyl-diphosphooligosaccharide-protein glycosyltransferase subunit dad1 [Lobulomyces angularis]